MAILTGDRFSNRLRGRLEDDNIVGLRGDDFLYGGKGSDTLDGGFDDDRLRGGDGSDTLSGGAGNDILYGHGADAVDPRSGEITATRIGTFDQPLFATAAPGGDPDLLYVVERTGSIQAVDVVTGQTSAFLTLPEGTVGLDGEQGLLGLAFDPDFATNGRAFISFIDPDGNTNIVRYTVSATDPAALDPDSATVIWQYPRNAPFTNHGGGWIGFGPDGYLYIASGDGGGGGDPDNNAQNIDSYLGKIHRIDVAGADDFLDDSSRNYAIPADNPFVGVDGADEVWAFGLRNPWRNSFDRETGAFYIADVGQNAVEEVNYQRPGIGGRNYGWVVREGDLPYDIDNPGNPGPNDPSLVDPILAYDHTTENGRSVTGGYVYRGPGVGLEGYYVYGDFINGRIATFRVEDGIARDVTDLTDRVVTSDGERITRIASFGEGADGSLYVMSILGGVYRLTPSAGAADGADTLDGGAGDDRLYGGAGADTLLAQVGNDYASGGFGDDTIAGAAGDDRLFGDDGDDRIEGGSENDRIDGGAGRDIIVGGSGDDILIGGDGDDSLVGGVGDDRLNGGTGVDVFAFGPNDGADRILDFEIGTDRLNLRSFAFASIDDALAFATDTPAGDVVFRFQNGEVLTVIGTTTETLAADIVV